MRIQRATFIVLVSPFLLAILVAYAQWLSVGLPSIPESFQFFSQVHPQGFPLWIGIAHYINLIFIILLIRSGLQILVYHQRLYLNVHGTPGTECIRFTLLAIHPRTSTVDDRSPSPRTRPPCATHAAGMAPP